MRKFFTPILYFIGAVVIVGGATWVSLNLNRSFEFVSDTAFFLTIGIWLLVAVLLFWLNKLLSIIERTDEYRFRQHFRQSLLLYLLLISPVLYFLVPRAYGLEIFALLILGALVMGAVFLPILVNAVFVLASVLLSSRRSISQRTKDIIILSLVILLVVGLNGFQGFSSWRTGKTVNGRIWQQERNISSIKSALFTYEIYSGSFPESLDDLTIRKDVLVAENTSSSFRSSQHYQNFLNTKEEYQRRPLLDSVPADVFTGEKVGYERNGFGYTLKYFIEYPEFKKREGRNALIETIYGDGPIKAKLKFVEGFNTTRNDPKGERVISQEAEAADFNLDTDGDGLTDTLEDYIGSDKNNSDQNNDGVLDGMQFPDNSSDPDDWHF